MASETRRASQERKNQARAERRLSRRRAQVARRLEWRTDIAQFMMAVDRTILAFWPLLACVFLFLAASALGLWSRIPDIVRFTTLGVFALATVGALILGVRRWRWPSKAEARAQLDVGRKSRPVASFDEELALGQGDAGSSALWAAHQQHVTEEAAAARAPMATLTVGGRRDPWAVRFFAALLLGGGLLLSPSGGRIADAFAPAGAEAATALQDAIELWAAPPDYTGLPPVYFTADRDREGVVSLPVGSTVFLSAFIESGEPVLEVRPRLDEEPLIQAPDGGYSAEVLIDRSRRIELVTGEGALPAIDLRFEPVPDRAPRVLLIDPPQRVGDGELGLSYAAADDYGVARAWVEIRLDPFGGGLFDTPPDAAEPEILEIDIPRGGGFVEGGGPPSLDNPTFIELDVSNHRWSGLPVIVSVTVEDAIGQQAETDIAAVMMPDLLLSEPMAKALVEQRRAMIWNIDNTPRSVRTLYAASEFPESYFLGSPIFLLIDSALHDLARGLAEDRLAETREPAHDKLWRAALRLEELGADNPPGRLERAQRRLREALNRDDITDQEIAELMAELRAAIEEYVGFLMELAATNPELADQLAQQFGGGGGGESLGRSQLEELLDELEDAARDGERQQAEDMLNALEELMESLRPNTQSAPSADGFGQPGEQQPQPDDRDVGEQMQDMIEEQQRLAEEGFDEYLRERRGEDEQQGDQGQQGAQNQPGDQGQQGGEDGQEQADGTPNQGEPGDNDSEGGRGGQDLAERQQQLREGLSELRDRLNEELPSELDDAEAAESRRRAEEALERAEEGMGRAEDRLREGDERGAAREQMDIIENLRDGFREFDRRLAERDGEDPEERRAGDENDRQGDRGIVRDDRTDDRENFDPLGRPLDDQPRAGFGANDDDYETDLGGFQSSREVLDELRKRLDDLERPAEERNYFERLLDDVF